MMNNINKYVFKRFFSINILRMTLNIILIVLFANTINRRFTNG